MIKSSAFYIALIIAFIIAIFSASLITTAYFYRLENQKNQRYQHLSQNLESGTALALSAGFEQTDSTLLLDLYAEGTDSLMIKKSTWGIFDYAVLASFTLNDTLKRSFLIAKDAKEDLTAIYLSDEDRPLSVSGHTKINGEALLPKAGIKQAYVEGKPFSGKKLVNGVIKKSGRALPALDKKKLEEIAYWLEDTGSHTIALADSLSNSFFLPMAVLRLNPTNAVISTTVKGNIVILCDTVITITRDAKMEDVIIYAPGIIVEQGFKGSCQLFAKDSIVAAKDVVFLYPSCLGVLKPADSKVQAKIDLASGSSFSGILFTYEARRSDLQTIISIGKNSSIAGEVYATGLLKMEKPLTIEGKVSCNRFIIQTPTTLYENYLIDITIDRPKRSKYFLSSALFAGFKESDNKILKWLN